MQKYFNKRIFIIFFLITFLTGCKEWLLPAAVIVGIINIDPDEDSENTIKNCEHPIQSSFDVGFVASRIADTIEYEGKQLDTGIYNEEIFSCYSGTMTISGILSKTEDEPCGVDCTRSYNNNNLVATLSDCVYVDANRCTYPYSINGDIVITDTIGIEILDNGTTTAFGDYLMMSFLRHSKHFIP